MEITLLDYLDQFVGLIIFFIFCGVWWIAIKLKDSEKSSIRVRGQKLENYLAIFYGYVFFGAVIVSVLFLLSAIIILIINKI